MAPALQNAGFEVLEAASGEDGLTQLADRDVDAVRVDVMLPGCDGIASAEQYGRTLASPC